MASLVRTRQGNFALGENVLEYSDLEKGEEVWGPKVQHMLEEWGEMQAREERAGKPTTLGEESVEIESNRNNLEAQADGGGEKGENGT